MLAREAIFKEITDKISWLTMSTQNRGLQGLFDQHVIAEHFFAGLLNRAFGWHLERTQLLRKNHAAIDLFDCDNHLVFQVTSDPKRKKVEHTIDLFIRKAADFHSCKLKILIIGKKKNYQKPFKHSNKISFFPKEDIWDTESLLSQLDNLDTSVLKEVRDYINQEIQGFPRRPEEMRAVDYFPRLNIDILKERIKRCVEKHARLPIKLVSLYNYSNKFLPRVPAKYAVLFEVSWQREDVKESPDKNNEYESFSKATGWCAAQKDLEYFHECAEKAY